MGLYTHELNILQHELCIKVRCVSFPYFCCPFQVEDAVNRATDNTNAAQELDILSLRAQLGSLTTVRNFHFLSALGNVHDTHS